MKAMHFLKKLGYISDEVRVTNSCGAVLDIERALDETASVFLAAQKKNKKIIFIGNGGSAAIASHQAIDYWKNGKIKAMSFNESSLLTCISNDLGYESVFSSPLEAFSDAEDVLVAISSSGQSKNILNAVESARKLSLNVVTLSGFDDTNPLRKGGMINFYVPLHNYGIVEVTHLSLLHAILDGIMSDES